MIIMNQLEYGHYTILIFSGFFIALFGLHYIQVLRSLNFRNIMNTEFDKFIANNRETIGRTLTRWLRYEIVRLCWMLVLIVAIVVIPISMITNVLNTAIGFLVELGAVFFAMIFSFYYNDAHVKIRIREENKSIFFAIIDELNENLVKLENLYVGGGHSYLYSLMKTTVWDIYKEKLGQFSDENVNKLSDIYYKLYTLNENIKKYPLTSDYDLELSSYRKVKKMKIDAMFDIKEWIPIIQEFYENNPIE